jgi:hypothetical protein
MLKPRATPWEIAFASFQAPTGRNLPVAVGSAPLGLRMLESAFPRALPWALIFRTVGAEDAQLQIVGHNIN